MFWRKFGQTEGTRWATGAADINLVILINAELQVSRQSATAAKVEPLIKVSRLKTATRTKRLKLLFHQKEGKKPASWQLITLPSRTLLRDEILGFVFRWKMAESGHFDQKLLICEEKPSVPQVAQRSIRRGYMSQCDLLSTECCLILLFVVVWLLPVPSRDFSLLCAKSVFAALPPKKCYKL